MASNLTTAGATAAMTASSLSGLYLALGTGADATGLYGEFSGGGYTRKSLGTMTKATYSAANAADVVFGPLTLGQGHATHWGVYDAASAGNCLWAGTLTEVIAMTNGASPTFRAGDVFLSFGTLSS